MDDQIQILSRRNSMTPDGGSSWNYGSQSMHSTRSSKPERLYKVWPGNNKFLCGGRLVLGPDAGSLYLSSFLIGFPAITFCIRMLVRIKEHDPLYGYGVLTTGVILTFMDLLFLYMTSVRDPGIIPRNHRPIEDEGSGSSSRELVATGKSGILRIPRTKDVTINGYTVKVKFCDTCRLYRPPRASHCSICNNCVQRFDHHCPWVGQCIGLRNYRFFIFFISSSTFLCIYVFTFSLINLLRRRKSLVHSMSRDVVSVILVVYCFVAVWFVGGLTLFHFYLMSTNQTTYENFRYRYDKGKNPHNFGVVKNIKQVLFTKTPPSAINFRELVIVEDVVLPMTPSDNESYTGFGKISDQDMTQRLTQSGRWVLQSNFQNFNHEDSDEKLKKKVGNQDTSTDQFLLAPGQASAPQGYQATSRDAADMAKKSENVDVS
ncbi:probable protein S-acyltransferase 3 isoform X1 [Chenopodium quinoa]|uniref:probable protein S-acyltransferase 3 isoform X1 n=1 Tax=Chenopodium quinoa TaxID=63459 RepID=UPI000B78717E|nr:probable protein S-acyltransferase 3 isoform X1 [Chenopodium quinoa]XP_021749141.1 probable protein S-acyltransferase 3 isoform X1 [Chenopodium quinoa]